MEARADEATHLPKPGKVGYKGTADPVRAAGERKSAKVCEKGGEGSGVEGKHRII